MHPLVAAALAVVLLDPMPAFVTDIDASWESEGVHVQVALRSESGVSDAILYRGLTPDFAQAVAVPGSPVQVAGERIDLWDRSPLAPGQGACYWAELVDGLGQVFTVGPVVPVAPEPGPAVTALLRLSPNPCVAGTTVRFAVGADVAGVGQARVRLAVVDARGRAVRTLDEEPRAAGSYEATWDGRDASGRRARAGVYWVRLLAGNRRLAQKLVLAR